MRATIFLLGLALALDVGLYSGLRQLSRERAELARRREELSQSVEALHETGEDGRRIGALLRNAAESIPHSEASLDIAELRDLLLGAERGLDIDRFSLDFRPGQDAPKGREGGRIGASLGGSFDALYRYLERIEELRLPLAPETLSMRPDPSGRILLAVEWNGLWSGEHRALDPLSPSDVARLEDWLTREPPPRPGRDLFFEGAGDVAPEPPPMAPESSAAPEASDAPPPDAREPHSSRPQLTGFVIARPEMETDVNRRVLAALRFEGELRMVGLGDVIGSYRVEEIDSRVSVLLVHQETGERLRLSLD